MTRFSDFARRMISSSSRTFEYTTSKPRTRNHRANLPTITSATNLISAIPVSTYGGELQCPSVQELSLELRVRDRRRGYRTDAWRGLLQRRSCTGDRRG